MKKIFLILFLIPALAIAQSDAANQQAIDSLLTNIAKKNNAKFLWRLFKGLNDSKINKDSAGYIVLQDTVFEIGDWNIATTAIKTFTLPFNYKKVRTVSIMTRDDSDTYYFPLLPYGSGAPILPPVGGYQFLGSGNILTIYRTANGSSTYTATSFNRGWIIIWYQP